MRVYIAKVINKSNVVFEAVFSTLEKAIECLRGIDISDFSLDFSFDTGGEEVNGDFDLRTTDFTFLVISKDLNSVEQGDEFVFSAEGDLIYRFDSVNNEVYGVRLSELTSSDEDEDAGKKFKLGDIVLIFGQSYSNHKYQCDYIGIIGGIPIPKEDWTWQEPWQNAYYIYFISDHGKIDRSRVQEKYIQLLNLELPFELSFLDKLSKIIKDEIILSEEVRDELFYGDMFVRTVNKYYKEFDPFKEG